MSGTSRRNAAVVLAVALLAAASLTALCAAGAAAAAPPAKDKATLRAEAKSLVAGWTSAAGPEWAPVDLEQAAVAAGTPLDMSRFVDGPAGKHDRVILGPTGRLVFEKRPDQAVLFFGCSIAPHQMIGERYTTKEEIRRWAEMVRRQGYNLVRPHFLDHYLTGKSANDLEFDPEALDRFDYLVACLKENGIYIYLDAMTSWRGYKAGPGWTEKAKAEDFKHRIFVEPAIREHWKAGVTKLLQHVNPYTKTRLADDPAVACVLFFNEQNMNFYGPKQDERFTEPWRAWLRAKHKTPEALRAAWVDAAGKPFLKADVTFETVPLFETWNLWRNDPRSRDAGAFLYDLHGELYDWFDRTIREIGYPGLVTHYDWLPSIVYQAVRSRVPVISMHNYHDHPTDFSVKGSSLKQTSSLPGAGSYFCSTATTRYAGRPLIVTEYGHVFWNKYRYEEGLLFGGYAALQGLDGLMPHATPVEDRITSPAHPFWVGRDPVGRASQVVTGYAWRAGYVAASPHAVEITLQKAGVFGEAQYVRTLAADQAKLVLLTGTGIAFPEGPQPAGLAAARKPDLRLPVFGTSQALVKEFSAEVVEGTDTAKPLAGVVATLKKVGILPPGNRTDVERGVFESDTGQLLLDAPNRRLQVIAPRMEGACVDPETTPGPLTLKQLAIQETSVPASVTAIAVDDKPLAESRRILLVYATDALNSGMAFTTDKRETLVANGKAPLLLRTGRLKISLATPHAAGLKVWALGFDGRRTESLPATAAGGTLSLSLDTARLKSATVFFEIAAE